MVSANGQAVFAVVAKDAASKVLKGVGKSFGSLKSSALTAFKAIGAAAATAVTAVAGFTLAAIKSAAEDEKASIRLTAALKARGYEMAKLTPAIEEQIKAMQTLGFTDDEVRDGIEVGSRFFKNQNNLLKANAVAANISAATGKPLASVMMAIGRGAQGSTRGLASLGIVVEKGAKLTDILRVANDKYKGVADEIAQSTAGRFEAAQIRLNEAFESFGAKFLPRVNDALTWFSDNILPGVEQGLDIFGNKLNEVIDGFVAPGGMRDSIGKVVGPILEDLQPAFEEVVGAVGGVVDSVSKLIGALWGDGEGALAFAFKALGKAIEVAFALAKPFFDALKWLVDNITAVINAMNKVSTPEAQARQAAAQNAAAGSTVYGLGANTGGGGMTTGGGYTSGYGVAPVSLTIGTRAQSELAYKFGQGVSTSTGTRTGGR